MLAFLVFIWGVRILRKVRHVALSGRATSSSRLLAPPMRQGYSPNWTPSPAPSPSHGRIYRMLHRGSSLHRPSIIDRIFRRGALRRFEHIQTSDPSDPIWINEKADRARARDAFMAGWTGKAAPKDWEDVRKVFKEFDQDWKVGKFKDKWAKE